MWKKLKSLEVNCLAFVFSGWHCASAALSFNSADLNQHSKKQIKRQHHTCAWYYFQFCMLKWSWTMFGGNTTSSNYFKAAFQAVPAVLIHGQCAARCHLATFLAAQSCSVSPRHDACPTATRCVTWPHSMSPSHALCHLAMLHATQPCSVSCSHLSCHP